MLLTRNNHVADGTTQAERRRGAMAETNHEQRVFALEIEPRLEL